MNKNWVSYWLIALIACQSVWAFADSHDGQINPAKLEINYSQSDVPQSDLSIDTENQGDSSPLAGIDNCDHCGFCHHGQLVLSAMLFSFPSDTARLNSQYSAAVLRRTLFAPYRPPKA